MVITIDTDLLQWNGPVQIDSAKTETKGSFNFAEDFQVPDVIKCTDKEAVDKAKEVAKWISIHCEELQLCEIFRSTPIENLEKFIRLTSKTECKCCGNNWLHMAVLRDSFETVDFLIKNSNISPMKDIINSRNNIGETALHLSCSVDNPQIMRYLLNVGADPNVTDSVGTYPLHICFAKFQSKQVEALLFRGAKVDTYFSKNRKLTPLLFSVQKGNKQMIQMILNQAPNVNVRNIHGISPLALVVQLNNKEAVKLLLKYSPDLNTRYTRDRTILHQACEQNREECVEMLLKAGLDVNTKDKDELTPLHIAAVSGQCTLAKMLVLYGCRINENDKRQRTPLHIAILCNQIETVEFLLSQSASTENLALPMRNAVKKGYIALIKLLIQNGVSVNLADKFGKTMLYEAVKKGDAEMVQYLLDKGSNIKIRGDWNCPIISEAIERNHLAIAKILIKNGADVCTGDELGRSSMFIALKLKNKEMVQLLLATNKKRVITEALLYQKELDNLKVNTEEFLQ